MKTICQKRLWDTDDTHYVEVGLYTVYRGLYLPFAVEWDRSEISRNWLVRVGFLCFEIELIRLSK